MSNRNLERIRNDYLSDQIRKKDMEAHIKDRQKQKALRARRRQKMEKQLLVPPPKLKEMVWRAIGAVTRKVLLLMYEMNFAGPETTFTRGRANTE